MKTSNNITVTIFNNYSTSKIKGTRKHVVDTLRSIAQNKRSESRQAHNLTDSVHSIASGKHQSKLVTMASFALSNCGLDALLELLNGHGSVEFKIA